MTATMPVKEQWVVDALMRGPLTLDRLIANNPFISSFEMRQILQRLIDCRVIHEHEAYYGLVAIHEDRSDAQLRLWPSSNIISMGSKGEDFDDMAGASQATCVGVAHAPPVLERLAMLLETPLGPLDLAHLSRYCNAVGVRGHLAVLTQPYLDRIIAGTKTIESRFSKVRGLPFQRVQADDVLLLKEVTGPLRAICIVTDATFFGPLAPGEAVGLMEQYKASLQLEQPFIDAKRDSAYVSLVHLGYLRAIAPVRVAKTDRRAWVLLDFPNNLQMSKVPTNQPIQQLSLFMPPTDCTRGFHRYYDSKLVNANDQRVCRYCGKDEVDWTRLHGRDVNDMEHTVAQLRTEAVREKWWTCEIDSAAQAHALRKGRIRLQECTRTRLRKSVGVVHDQPDGTKRPYRDGLQTPYHGNCIYYAQHALACCCRKCISTWHGIPNGRDLTDDELDYFVALVMQYITNRLPELGEQGISVPRQRRC